MSGSLHAYGMAHAEQTSPSSLMINITGKHRSMEWKALSGWSGLWDLSYGSACSHTFFDRSLLVKECA